MTDLYRIFDKQTRSISTDRKSYGGQVFDSQSTHIHFKLLNGGEAWDFEAENYVPHIVFNVYDQNGNPYVYGPTSSPIFLGTDFTIPYEITSQARSLRVEYALWWVKAEVADNFNGTPEGLLYTEYLNSAVDGIAFRASCVKPPKPGCGCGSMPYAPTTAPSVIGPLEYFRSNAVIRPIGKEAHVNEFGEQQGYDLYFRTLSGECQELWLNVPVLTTEGKLDPKQLPTGNGYGQIPVLKSMVGNKQTIIFDGEAGGFIGARLPATLKYIPQTASENGGVVRRHLIVLQDAAGVALSEVDLPIENLITGAEYDPASKPSCSTSRTSRWTSRCPSTTWWISMRASPAR